jgi:hypothetical protein
VERLVKSRQGVLGLGQHQVTTQVERVERSVAVATMAYLILLQAKPIPADCPWSAFQRQRQFPWEVLQAQGRRSARQLAREWRQMGKAK